MTDRGRVTRRRGRGPSLAALWRCAGHFRSLVELVSVLLGLWANAGLTGGVEFEVLLEVGMSEVTLAGQN